MQKSKVLIISMLTSGVLSMSGCTMISPSKPATQERDRQIHIKTIEEESDVSKVRSSLLRLASLKDPQGFEAAKKLSKRFLPFDRESAAMALRFYSANPEALDLLLGLTKDPELKVRQSALQILSRLGANPTLEAKAKEELAVIPSSQERARWLTVLHNSTTNSRIHAQIKTELFKDLESKNSDVAHSAFQALLKIMKDQKALQQQLHQVLRKSQNFEFLRPVLRYLSFKKDPLLSELLPRFLNSTDPLVRKFAIQAAFDSCTETRWSLLRKLAQNEKDLSVLNEIVKKLQRLGGKQSVVIAEILQTKSELKNSTHFPEAEEINSWRERDDRDPCSTPKLPAKPK